jgi:hypothetical protein
LELRAKNVRYIENILEIGKSVICPQYQKTGTLTRTGGYRENKEQIGLKWSVIVFN